MIDTHVHTKHCPHAEGEVSEYVKAAKAKGISVIGFSEHYPLPEGFKDPVGDCAMKRESLAGYLSELKAARGPNVLAGTEVDYIPGYADELKSLKGLGLDYVIGSVHFIGGWVFDYSDEVFAEGLRRQFGGDIDRCIGEYFRLVQGLVKSDAVDVVAHLDLIKKFNGGGKYFRGDNEAFASGIERTLQLIRMKGLILEVNTSGFDKPAGDMYPSEDVLRRAHELDIGITLGSDAHKPSQVGRHFDKALACLRGIGYDRLCFFRGRNPDSVALV
ncbi:MAG: histidinol-phosphatase HisJ [Candidatus Altiarchaeota archaeon]